MQSKAQQAAVARYNAKTYRRVDVRLKFELDDKMRQHIARNGDTVNGFITAAIMEKLERDDPGDPDKTE